MSFPSIPVVLKASLEPQFLAQGAWQLFKMQFVSLPLAGREAFMEASLALKQDLAIKA